MKILIIEDETKTAKALARIITTLQPQAVIPNHVESVAAAVSYLKSSAMPDVIFMDIQLADGTCFEIFSQVEITAPVVFCTAFDEYAIEAFKSNGIDYIHKPFEKADIRAAFEKIHNLKNFFQQDDISGKRLETVLNGLVRNTGKTNFLVFKHHKYSNIPTDKIACFYSQLGETSIITFDGEEYCISHSLDELAQMIGQEQFFRINRQYLLNFSAITEIEHYFSRKLLVKLKVDTPEKLLVTKERASNFLQWLEKR